MSGTTCFVDGEFSREKGFFETFPIHPIEPGTLDNLGLQTVKYPGRKIRVERFQQVDGMSLESLCDSIVKHAVIPGDIMVICHGSEHGLTLPIVKGGTRCRIGAEAVKMLLSRDAGKAAYYFNMNADQGAVIERVQEKLRAVHKKKIGHLAIRACAVGKSMANVDQLLRLFGVRTGSALKMRVFCAKFGGAKLKSDPGVWSSRGFGSTWQVYNEAPDRIAFQTSGGEEGNIHFNFNAVEVESEKAVDLFVDNYLPGAVKKIKDGTVKMGKSKIAVLREVERDFVLKDSVPCYFTYDGIRMRFVNEAKFSDSLVYRQNPDPQADPFGR
jgi:hypothetical protein